MGTVVIIIGFLAMAVTPLLGSFTDMSLGPMGLLDLVRFVGLMLLCIGMVTAFSNNGSHDLND